MNRIVRIMFGSHLYGTNTPASDLDYKAIFIPPARDILMQRTKEVVAVQRAKSEGEKNFAGEHDEESYALHRFMQLVHEGQTVSLDALFAPPSAWLLYTDPWLEIVKNRHRLLTKKSASFVGYCRTQANKYGIRGSRVSAAKAAMEFFEQEMNTRGTTARLSEIPHSVHAFSFGVEHCKVVQLEQQHGQMLDHFECCNKKVPFTNTIKSAYELYKRVYDEYGHRARAAANNENIDWKALSHAVRISDEAQELVTTGFITFPRPNANHLLDIKLGKLTYDEVAKEIEEGLEKIEALSLTSTLPDRVDLEWMEDFTIRHYGDEVVTEASRGWYQ